MGTVLAVFAFILSFGALWFTSEILKRIDGHTETAIKPHLKAFETSLGNHADALDRLSRRMDTLEVDVRTLKAQGQSTVGMEHEMKFFLSFWASSHPPYQGSKNNIGQLYLEEDPTYQNCLQLISPHFLYLLSKTDRSRIP